MYLIIGIIISLIVGFIVGNILTNSANAPSNNYVSSSELFDKISYPLYQFKNMDSETNAPIVFWEKHKIERDVFRIDTTELNHVFDSLECEEKLLSKNHPIAPNSNSEPVYFCLIEKASYNFADCFCYYALLD